MPPRKADALKEKKKPVVSLDETQPEKKKPWKQRLRQPYKKKPVVSVDDSASVTKPEVPGCISNTSTKDSADGSDAEGDAIARVMATFSKQLWQGSEGEQYKIRPLQGNNGWNVIRTFKQSVEEFPIIYDDCACVIWLGSCFFDLLELGRRPSEIKWYSKEDLETTRPKFVWKALPVPASAVASKPLFVPATAAAGVFATAPVATEKTLLVPALPVAEKPLPDYQKIEASSCWGLNLPSNQLPGLDIWAPYMAADQMSATWQETLARARARAQRHGQGQGQETWQQIVDDGEINAPSPLPPNHLAGLDIMAAADMMAADMAADQMAETGQQRWQEMAEDGEINAPSRGCVKSAPSKPPGLDGLDIMAAADMMAAHMAAESPLLWQTPAQAAVEHAAYFQVDALPERTKNPLRAEAEPFVPSDETQP